MDIHLFASDKVLLRTSHSLPHAAAADDRGLKISKPDDAIFKLEEFILEEKYEALLLAMEAVRHTEENDVVVQAVISLSEMHNRVYALLRQAIFQAITNLTETENMTISAFFRGGCTATQLLSSWMFREGEPYLQRTLYPFVCSICQNDLCFELDPNRESDPARLLSNLSSLLCTAKRVVDHICCSLNSIPIILRRIFWYLGSEIKQRFPDEVKLVISGFFFLRFLCPALVTPSFYGIYKAQPSAVASRSLILLSKLLQTVSSGTEFGMKEHYLCMPALNHFVALTTPRLNHFFSLLIEEEQSSSLFSPRAQVSGEVPVDCWASARGSLSGSGNSLKTRALSVDNTALAATGSGNISPRRNHPHLTAYFDRSGVATPPPLSPSVSLQSPASALSILPSSAPPGMQHGPAAAAQTTSASIAVLNVMQQPKQVPSPSQARRSRVLNNFKAATIRGVWNKKSNSVPSTQEQGLFASSNYHRNTSAIRIIRYAWLSSA